MNGKKLVLFLALVPGVVAAKPKDKDPKTTKTTEKSTAKMGGASTAVTNEILDAVAGEMNRAMSNLQLGQNSKPYYISYKITEVDQNNAVASLGYTTSRKENHFVTIEARVRVGSKDFDNANFIVPGGDSIDGVAQFPLPLEATPRIAARATWLVTDQAYKEALIQLRAKQDARASGGATNQVPSWSDSKPVVTEDPVLVPELESLDDLEKRADKLSETFRNDDVRDSRVALTSYLERRWYLDSDGEQAHDTRRVSGVLVAAMGQADDGQDLPDYFVKYGHTAADLPDDAALTAEAKTLVDTIAQMAKAPQIDHYAGPVLFEGQGAADITRWTLAPNVGGTPLPEGMRPQDAKAFGGQLEDKLGLKVTAPALSIVDDPTSDAVGGVPVIGGYNIDDEGVAAQKVSVVKSGMLADLLRSRTPSKKGEISNGHARRVAPGGMFHGTATNLVLTAKGGLDHKGLVKKLLAEAKSDGLGYGVIVRAMDDASITANPEMTRRDLLAMYQNADADQLPPALLVYKVTPNGKEQLVRMAQIGEVPIAAWKDILAVGKTQTVENFLSAGDTYIVQKVNGADDTVPSSGIESAIAVPDLLFKEIDLTPYTIGTRQKPSIPEPDGK